MAHSETSDDEEAKKSAKERLFFGETAMQDFWDLYKSNRQFKDYNPSKC
jgi:hypothetical protein